VKKKKKKETPRPGGSGGKRRGPTWREEKEKAQGGVEGKKRPSIPTGGKRSPLSVKEFHQCGINPKKQKEEKGVGRILETKNEPYAEEKGRTSKGFKEKKENSNSPKEKKKIVTPRPRRR